MPDPNNIYDRNDSAVKQVRLRRTLIRDFIDRNYGVPVSRNDFLSYLDSKGMSVSLGTLERDFRQMNVMLIEAFVGGRKVRFWSEVQHVPEHGADNLRTHVDPDTIETNATREVLRTAADVFTDGKRVVITTGYEQAKHLALWIKNLVWPEIWYLSKEDGSVIIIECKTPEKAEFLKRRFWGLRGEDLIGTEEEEDA